MISNSNGMNAFQAHRSRVGNDITFTRGIVESYLFIGFGTVARYANERVDVICGARKFTNVEVVVFGVDGWGIKPVPAVNDRVMLFSEQSPIPDLKEFSASGSMPAYDPSGLKAVPITDSDTAQLITVSRDGIEITGNNKVTIDDKGIQIEDANGNKVVSDNKGVAFEDLNGNKVTADDKGVAFEDLNKNKATTNDKGVAFEDLNKNKITTDDKGMILEDANGNKYTGASAGITIEDANGCKIVSSSTSIKINNNLEISK
jgi:hypothetical protein